MVDRIKRYFNLEHGIKSATLLLTFTLLLSNVLGLLRNILLASQATSLTQLDTYYAAFRLPDLIFNLLVLGSVSSAFIPVYAKVFKNKGTEEASKLANALLGTLVVSLVVCLGILYLLMPTLIPIMVAKFTVAQQQETIHLARIMLLSPLFFGFSYVVGAILNSHKRFFSYSIAPLIYNVAIIVGALLLPYYGITAVAWSVVFGALLHFLIQVPATLKIGVKFKLKFQLYSPEIKQIIKLMIPRAFSSGVAQFVLLGFTYIAASLSPGALTIYSLTNDFQTTPAILFGTSLAIALFPTLSDAVAENDHFKFQNYLKKSLIIGLFLLIPLMLIVYILRAQIMRLYIGLGHNTNWDDTIRSINTLSYFSLSFVAQSFVQLLSRSFYALQDTRRPMYGAIIGAVVTIGLAIMLPQTNYFRTGSLYDVAGLAAAYSVGLWVQVFVLFLWLPRKWKGDMSLVWSRILPITGLTLISGFATWVTLRIVGNGLKLEPFIPVTVSGLSTHTVVGLLIQGAAAGIVGIGLYALMAYWFKFPEIEWLIKFRKESRTNEQK
jgi:putative peptidoglycan lipid II flippase